MRGLRIRIVTPSPSGLATGNNVTAERWAGILRHLGHHARVVRAYAGERCDVLVALHARKSAAAIDRFRREHPTAPLIVALTGTDLYDGLARSRRACRSLEQATRVVVLQSDGPRAVPREIRPRTRVVFQSAPHAAGRRRMRKDVFEVCVLAHLRPVKDPLRAALAARELPAGSRIRILHLGAALTPGLARRAEAETARNPRYRWLGSVSRARALRALASSRALLVTSRLEGAGNAVAEALAAGVPILSSRIPGVIGSLGPNYPGYFPVGDTHALAALLARTETDAAFYEELRVRCRHLAPLADPHWERETWRELLAEIKRD